MVYLDNAASTPVHPDALRALSDAAGAHPANPSAAHGLGAAAARALEASREAVAAWLRARARDLVFTSGGTEANALGLLGSARAQRKRHIVCTGIEHPSVLRNLERLEAEGFEVVRVSPSSDGVVPAERVLEAVTSETALVAMMWVNNELGTRQPVEAVARGLRALPHPVALHVDAVQGAPFLRLDVGALGASTVAVSGHKLHAPKGVGALWVHPEHRLAPLWEGGGQETGLRSGTENLPGCAGFATAVRLLTQDLAETRERVAHLRDTFEREVARDVPRARPTVPPDSPRAPHVSSLRIADLPAEPLLHALEGRGVYASAGSACASKRRGQSPTLALLGIPERDAVLRFSFSRLSKESDVHEAIGALVGALDDLRFMRLMAPRRRSR
ncbi:MAG: cysteine desulfurase [Myxococcales bacterium]|nr:cysteine desulfurase [Myxococcales bacterium]